MNDAERAANLLPARHRPPGRPTKFTPATRARLVKLVARGLPFVHACNAVGVTFQSLSSYRDQHPDFREEIERAVSAAIEKRLEVIERAAEAGDVNSAKWLLEHLHPQFFARNRIELAGADGAPLAGAIAVYLPRKDGEETRVLPAVVTDSDDER